MTQPSLALAIITDNNNLNFVSAASPTGQIKIKAMAETQYLLVKKGTFIGPEQLTVHRNGKNLEIFSATDKDAKIIIEDYYDHPNQIFGVDNAGHYHEYVQSAANQLEADALAEGESAAMVMVPESEHRPVAAILPNVTSSGFLKAAGAFAGLLGLGGIISTFHHNHHGSGESPIPAPDILSARDDVGAINGIVHSGEATNDSQPLFQGKGQTPGATIQIFDNGTLIGSTVIAADGSWEFTPQPLDHGVHYFSAVETDGARVSQSSPLFELNVDLLPPDVMLDSVSDAVAGGVVGAIGNDGTGLTNDAQPRLSGTAEAGNLVIIYDGETAIGSVVADATTGVWSWQYQGVNAFTDGTHTLSVTATDAVGNVSAHTDGFIITVDTTISQPTLDSVMDAVAGGALGAISNDGTGLTNDAQPRLSGTADAGTVVTIYDGATAIGSAQADAVTGVWSWQYVGSEHFGEGQHVLTVRAVDPAGNVSIISNGFTITVDTTIAQPTLDSVTDAVAGGVVGAISHDGTGLTNDAQPRLSGKAESGSVVTIYDGATAIGSVVANATTGVWSWQYGGSAKFAEGRHVLTVQAVDTAGNVSVISSGFTITVDTIIAQPTLDSVTDAVAGGVVGAIGKDGTGLTNDAKPLLSGKAEAGSVVTIYDGTTAIGSVVANASTGVWSWQYSGNQKFAEGQHVLTVRAVDTAGNTSVISDSFTITVDTVIAQPTLDTVADAVAGGVVGDVPRDGTGLTNDARPMLSGKAETGSLVTIYDNGVAVGSVNADASTGAWQWQPALGKALTDGSHVLTVVATDRAGNVSASSDGFTVQVDTIAPINASLLVSSVDPAAVWDQANNITNDARPQLSGQGENGALVTIHYNGNTYTTTVQNGVWSWRPALALSEGPQVFTVTLTDAAGNVSASTGAHFTIDTLPPVARAVVTGMSKDSGTNTHDFITNDGSAGRLVQGTLTAPLAALEKVQISFDNGIRWIDVNVNPDGSWSAVDISGHSTDWTIMTRVINSVGTSTSSQQEVVLDTRIPLKIDNIDWDGTTISVDLSGKNLHAGEKIIIQLDNERIEHVLTQSEIDANRFDFPWSSAAKGNTDKISLTIINEAGTASETQVFNKQLGENITEDFEGQSAVRFAQGNTFSFSEFDLEVVKLVSDGFTSGFGKSNQGGVGTPPTSMALEMAGNGTTVKFSLDETKSFNHVSFIVGDLSGNERLTAIFYDNNGDAVYTATRDSSNGRETHIEFDLPYGTYFTSFQLTITGNAYIWIDDINFSNIVYQPDATPEIPDVTQHIDAAQTWLGGDEDNIFTLADVSLLSQANFFLDGSHGMDTLQLTGANQTLDLSQLGSKINSIEVFDITGTGNNTLKVGIADVLAQGGTDLFINDGKVQMMVKGNTGDNVDLSDLLPSGTDSSDWNQGSSVNIAGVEYQIWQHSGLDAELLVQDGVTVNAIHH